MQSTSTVGKQTLPNCQEESSKLSIRRQKYFERIRMKFRLVCQRDHFEASSESRLQQSVLRLVTSHLSSLFHLLQFACWPNSTWTSSWVDDSFQTQFLLQVEYFPCLPDQISNCSSAQHHVDHHSPNCREHPVGNLSAPDGFRRTGETDSPEPATGLCVGPFSQLVASGMTVIDSRLYATDLALQKKYNLHRFHTSRPQTVSSFEQPLNRPLAGLNLHHARHN